MDHPPADPDNPRTLGFRNLVTSHSTATAPPIYLEFEPTWASMKTHTHTHTHTTSEGYSALVSASRVCGGLFCLGSVNLKGPKPGIFVFSPALPKMGPTGSLFPYEPRTGVSFSPQEVLESRGHWSRNPVPRSNHRPNGARQGTLSPRFA